MKLGQTSLIFFLSKFGSSLIGFVATLYIARMLGAEVYGIYALALAVLAWLKIGGNVGLSSAITKRVSEGDEPDAYLVTGLSMMTAIFVLTALAVILLRGPIERYIGAPVLAVLIVLLAAELFRSYTSAVLQGQHLVHIYSILDPVSVTIRSALQIGVVAIGLGVAGLLAAYAVASFAVAVVSIVFLSIGLARPTFRHAKSLFDYAKYAWLGSLKKQSFSWVDVTVLGFFVSTSLVGVYAIAWSIAAVLTIFSKGISTTLFPEISKLTARQDPSQISNLITDAVRYNGLILIPGLVGAAIVGERILLLYGEEFVIGTAVLLILIVARTIYGYQRQFVNTINGIDRPDVAFRINAVFIAVNVSLNVVLIWHFGWIGAAVATMLASAVSLGHAYYALRRFVEFDVPTMDVAYQCLAALSMGLVIFILVVLGPPMDDSIAGHAFTVVLVSIGAVIYLVVLFVISARFRTTIERNLPFDVPALMR